MITARKFASGSRRLRRLLAAVAVRAEGHGQEAQGIEPDHIIRALDEYQAEASEFLGRFG